MRLAALALLIPLAACAGGPLATDAEVEWLLAENAAQDQEFALKADAEIVADLEDAGVILTAYAPPVAAVRPDPAARPEDGFEWETTLQVAIGSIGAAIAAYFGVMAKRGPPTKTENLLKAAQHPPA